MGSMAFRMLAWSEPGDPRVENEDFVATSADVAVVLDGVTPLDRDDTGCQHGVAWYARTLGTYLLQLAGDRRDSLADCLATAIRRVRDDHAGTCDLDHFDSPAATVSAVRVRDGRLEYLVLSDASVVLDLESDGTKPDIRWITDHRASEVGRRLRAAGIPPTGHAVRTHRNRAGGYWVAAERPEAAYQALGGSVPVAEVRRAVIASDGATRLIDVFGLFDWTDALDLIEHEGVDAYVARTRAVEKEDAARPSASRVNRGKTHDDTTLVFLTRWT
ncbi:protein phosphatase 2C-like protein [Thermasporomyces composti]|uniref:Protein phosphatase 2C-like protein n=2 Tax=Thermasporomyces composti TaxID=696763 RepID=A0A3D9V2Y1_THECX|nr:protein phosphatase 2C-like protein [Thermasporomyces composti]